MATMTMEYRNLGASGVKVSTLCLGTMTFGEADETSTMHQVGCDEDTALVIMSRALDAGINFLDTADVYGQDGLAERVVGKWLQKERTRDRVVLATKFRFRMADGPNGTGASRYRIVRAVEDSLRRLGTDRIDLYQIHMQDISVPEDETLRALDDLVRAGKVLYLGASNYAAYRLVDSLWTSRERRLERFVSLQAMYNLSSRELERELLPACRKHGVGVLPWSPLAGGFLSGKYDRDAPPPAGARLTRWKERLAAFDTPRNWRILDAVKQVAGATGRTPAEVSLAWLLGRPGVTSLVFGARSLEQLEGNLGAASWKLAPEHTQALDAASAFEVGYPYDFLGRVQGAW
jgi:aryl-alcohol dehydrogenase-like predicted oxidoreductase